jgi:hypothetical protein
VRWGRRSNVHKCYKPTTTSSDGCTVARKRKFHVQHWWLLVDARTIQPPTDATSGRHLPSKVACKAGTRAPETEH